MLIIASWFAATVTIVAAIVPTIDLSLPGRGTGPKPAFPAAQGYLLPWAGGEIHSVTQGEETTLTHNGAAAYAFDFDLDYETVVAARSGKVSYVRQDSNSGGCDAIFAGSGNYVVIDHGDGTSALYLHLAFNSVLVKPGDLVDQGQPIAVSGETGLTCGGGGDDKAPGPHLHFQVERTEENRYFTQSLPIALDDISSNGGVPVEGKSYVSGNYGRGKPQKIKLTPWRVPREFNPVAKPEDPVLIEALHDQAPPRPDAPGPAAPQAAETPGNGSGSQTPSAEPTPDGTNTPRPTRTPSPTPTATPSDTPSPPTATPVTVTATPVAATATATSEPPTPVPPTPAPEPTTSGVGPPSPVPAPSDTATATP